MLVSIGQSDINIVVDDLDLGFQIHRQYLRALIDSNVVRDNKFEDYSFEDCHIIGTGRESILKGKSKLAQRIVQL